MASAFLTSLKSIVPSVLAYFALTQVFLSGKGEGPFDGRFDLTQHVDHKMAKFVLMVSIVAAVFFFFDWFGVAVGM